MKYSHLLFLSLILFFCSLGSLSPALAQNATESVAELDKAERPVFKNIYPYSEKIVMGALKEKLRKDNISFKQRRNSITSKGVVYSKLFPNPIDIYFQLEGTGRKKHQSTTVKMFISKGMDNFINGKYNETIAENTLEFLNNFQQEVEYYALTKQMDEKEQSLKKVTDQYTKLLDSRRSTQAQLYTQKKAMPMLSGDDLKKTRKGIKKNEKRIKRTEKKLNKTEKEMQSLKRDIETLKTRLAGIQKEQIDQ